MATATVPVKLLVTVALVVMLVLGLAIGYVASDATRSDMPMQMPGMGMSMGDVGNHMSEMSAHMEAMGMDMGSMRGSGAPRNVPPMHGHD